MKHILVADDEPHVQKLLERNLTQAGYRVTRAQSGHEALQRIAEELPDLAVIDVMMPYMDGGEVLYRLRQDPATRNLPVILMPSRNADATPIRNRWPDADYLMKPFTPEELLVKLEWRFRYGRLPPCVLAAGRDQWDCWDLVRALEKSGLLTDWAIGGEETLARIARQAPDLLIMDLEMPGLDGAAVVRGLKQNLATAQVPTVMLLEKAADLEVFRGWSRNVEYYVTRPFIREQLVRFANLLLRAETETAEFHGLLRSIHRSPAL